jgi:hypothetical protein
MKARERHRCSGSTLLETIGATALSGVMLASATASMANAVRIMRDQIGLAGRLELARSRLEAELGAPCVELVPCPSKLRCKLEREHVAIPRSIDSSGLVRLHSVVGVRNSPQADLRLTTLARRRRPCP